MRIYKGISYSDISDECYLDVRLPDGDEEFYCLVYFHGGGLTQGGTFEPFLEPLTENGVAVVSIQYRMYPNAKYPEFIEDAANSVKWTFDNISRYGKCKGIFVGGSSAGGYISQMLCFDSKYLKAAGVDPMAIRGYIHDAGQPTAHFNVLATERGLDRFRVIVDESAPLYHMGVEKEYPPMLFIVSDNDMPGRYEQTLLAIATLRTFGISGDDKVRLKVMHGNHCAYVKELYENGKSLLADLICEQIKLVTGE